LGLETSRDPIYFQSLGLGREATILFLDLGLKSQSLGLGLRVLKISIFVENILTHTDLSDL